jgi:hypothetical protein
MPCKKLMANENKLKIIIRSQVAQSPKWQDFEKNKKRTHALLFKSYFQKVRKKYFKRQVGAGRQLGNLQWTVGIRRKLYSFELFLKAYGILKFL